MQGGVDLVTPRIALDAGKCFDAQNYEPVTVGGYRRINGFERYDGRPSPTAAVYWTLAVTITGTVAVGNTVTGVTSAATGKVLGIVGSTLVLGRVSGSFVINETLNVGGVGQATTTGTAFAGGATSTSDDADYRLLAANDLRGDIGTVPGSGAIRGIFVLADTTYALRDNVGATASLLYKATAGGWANVPLGTEIQFTSATGQINDGDTITGGTSGATATVKRAMLRAGSWTAAGVGTLVITVTGGTFQNAEALKVGGVSMATSSSLATAIVRQPGGRLESVTANFTGSTATKRTYGADGANYAFEFDGTIYCPIRTGMAVDTPSHIAEFRNYLFLSFLGSVQFSSIGQPYTWSVILGAGEISTGSAVTGFALMAGTQAGAAMGIFTDGRQFTLYGTSASNFVMVPSNYDLGFQSRTIQLVSNNVYGLTARGLQSLLTTLNYGDFEFASLSFLVQPLINAKVGTATASVSLKTKNQYRIYFADGTALALGLTGEKVAGIMPLNYGKTVRCMCNSTLTTGQEVTYFGSDDGYVYQDNIGTSFDGSTIEAWLRPAFNNLKSPRVRKQFRRAIFEVQCEGFSKVNISYDLGYANPLSETPAAQSDQQLQGVGGYWDQLTWDQFTWDSPIVANADISLDGTENNIAFLFYSNRAQDDSHVCQGVNLLYTPRRLVHSGT
jgi:hypothetical protein